MASAALLGGKEEPPLLVSNPESVGAPNRDRVTKRRGFSSGAPSFCVRSSFEATRALLTLTYFWNLSRAPNAPSLGFPQTVERRASAAIWLTRVPSVELNHAPFTPVLGERAGIEPALSGRHSAR